MGNVYTISDITKYISNMFDTDFLLRNVCVKGEVSNLKYHTSGHIYFTLKDEKSSLASVMFKGHRAGLTYPMKDGDSVLVNGQIKVYPVQGKYQMYATEIKNAGIGDLYARYEELKRQFQEMGMFDEAYKRPIPRYATRIGIVTAETGAAIQDIMRISTRRNPHVQLFLYPALVQGEGAAESVAEGIATLDEMNLDVMIVGRGGGSIEDLWAFNEEAVARAIFSCDTPIISAVGHESDTTIADFVADKVASTPSAAAEMAVFEYDRFCEDIKSYESTLNYAIDNKVKIYKNKVDVLKNRIELFSPINRLNQYQLKLDECQDKLNILLNRASTAARHKLEMYANRLDGLSPAKKLSSGFSYVADASGNNIKDVSQVSKDDKLKIYLHKGTIEATVDSISED